MKDAALRVKRALESPRISGKPVPAHWKPVPLIIGGQHNRGEKALARAKAKRGV